MQAATLTKAQAATLTKAQTKTVQHLQDYSQGHSIMADWFVGEETLDGTVEVIAIAIDRRFVWSFLIPPEGGVVSTEGATLGDWRYGMECNCVGDAPRHNEN